MIRRVVVYGYWRTGTNLLIDILQNRNYFNLDEYFGHVLGYSAGMIEPERFDFLKKDLNAYLRLIHSTNKIKRSVVKVMLPHTNLTDNITDELFTSRILVHRNDFKQTIISKIIASARGSWRSYIGRPKQPLYSDSIDLNVFEEQLSIYIRDYNIFLDKLPKLDTVADYDLDLVPYVNINGTRMIKSNNYFVGNQSEIDQLYSKYTESVKDICNKVGVLRLTKRNFNELLSEQ